MEIKSFLGPSVLTDFHAALGQFLNYRMVLDARIRDGSSTWPCPRRPTTSSSCSPLARNPSRRHRIHLIVYDPETEALQQWIT